MRPLLRRERGVKLGWCRRQDKHWRSRWHASTAMLLWPANDSGWGWVAGPFPFGSFIHYSLPAVAGASPTALFFRLDLQSGKVQFEPFVLLEQFFHRQPAVAQGGSRPRMHVKQPSTARRHRGILEPAGANILVKRGDVPLRSVGIEVRHLGGKRVLAANLKASLAVIGDDGMAGLAIESGRYSRPRQRRWPNTGHCARGAARRRSRR